MTDGWSPPDAYPIDPVVPDGAKRALPPSDHVLVVELAAQLEGVPLETIQRVLAALPTAAAQTLLRDGAVEIPGVVHAYLRELPARRARQGINPYTGGPMMKSAMPKRAAVTFRSFLDRELGEWEPILE